MAFNFPSSPTVGQEANGYVWDGEKWIVVGDAAIAVPEAPVDGVAYARKDAAWVPEESGASSVLSITDFGAVSGGAAATNSAALAAAFAAALAGNKAVYIPAGVYAYDTPLVVTGLVPVFGDGQEQSALWYSGAGIALLFQPSASGTPYLGHYLRDFQIQVDGPGAVGITVELVVGAHYASFDWDSVKIGAFATTSARLLNTAGNTDGFFLGSIKRCTFNNGIVGALIGDSINIEENKIHGTGDISFSMVGGARSLIFSSNNVTNSGAILFNNCAGVVLESNQLEMIDSYTGAVDARVYFANCQNVVFRNNRSGLLGAVKPFHNVLIDGASSFISLDDNELTKGTGTHIAAGPSTADILVGNTKADEGNSALVVSVDGPRSFQTFSNIASVGNADFTIAPQYTLLVLAASLTAPRTWTLPLASAVRPGFTIRVVDMIGAVSAVNTLTIARAGADLINGDPSVILYGPLSSVSLTSDGSGRWHAVSGDSAGQWLPYTSTFSATTGTAIVTARFKAVGKTIFVNISVQLTSAVTGTFAVTLPALSKSNAVISGKEIAMIGTGAAGFVVAGGNSLSVLSAAGEQYTGSGNIIVLTGGYEAV